MAESVSQDDWRVELDVAAPGGGHKLTERLHERRIASRARERLGDRATVSVDAHRLFAYTGAEADAREAAAVLEELAGLEELVATVTISRWHPEEERWEDPEVALPTTDAERRAEHARLQEDERRESERQGYPGWEVEVELADRDAASALFARLEAEGLPLGRRGHDVVVIGAATEDDAGTLAARMRAEMPDATRIEAQGSAVAAWDQLNRLPYRDG